MSLSKVKAKTQIILVDDGSNDGSSEICDFMGESDGRIMVIHQENRGLSAARNMGITAAEGEYVVFLDSDDFLKSTALDEFNLCLQTHPRIDVLITRVSELYPNGKVLDRDPGMERFLPRQSREVSKDDAIKWVFCQSDCASIAPRFIVRTDLLRKNGILFEEGRLHEDIGWVVELMAYAKTFCFFTDRWYYYRKGTIDSISDNMQLKNIEDAIYFTKKYLSLSRYDDLSERQKNWIRASLSSGCCFFLSKLTGMDKASKRHAAKVLGSAEIILHTKRPKQRLFAYFMRLVGCEKAIISMTAVREWKIRMKLIVNHIK